MDNPVLVEVTRGGHVESRHRGAFCVIDGHGDIVMQGGDIARPVFPRSAVKIIQALPFLESGAADAYGFGDTQLAMACASHSGEPGHVEAARAMLAAAGLDDSALECGAHWSGDQATIIAQARTLEAPTPAHNNCSGKHSSFLCTCVHMGLDHLHYVDPAHRYQQMIAQAMSEVTGAAHDETNIGIDGCAIPTYAVPVQALAQGFAWLASGRGLELQRAKAVNRLMSACMAKPWFVAGTGRLDTRVMEAAGKRIFLKVGAEGVYCAAIPELGLGMALKCDDGTERAAEVMICGLLARLLPVDDDLTGTIRRFAHVAVRNRNGLDVGEMRPAGPLIS